MKALLACAPVAFAALAVTVEPARACSCIPPDPWKILPQADGAFVGSLVSRRETDQGRVVLTFSVERRVKGRIGSTVEVATADNSAACGIEVPVGRRIGLFLLREGGRWVGHLCWLVEPEDLLAAAALPPPNGKGPVALLVSGIFGPARTLALDTNGRTLAYGMGAGPAAAFSVCPGGRRVAEVVDSGTGYKVVIRDLPSLRFIRQQRVSVVYAGEVACVEPDGDQLAVFDSDTAARGRLTRVTTRGETTLWRGKAFYASFWSNRAYIHGLNRRGTTLIEVDLRGGGARTLGTVPVPGPSQLVPNAAGTRLAGEAFEEGCRARCYRLVLINLRHPISARTTLLPAHGGETRWLGDGRIAYVRGNRVLVYDRTLRLLARVSKWNAISTAALGSRLVGIGRFGKLLRMELPSGRFDVMRRLPGAPRVIVSATR